MPVIDRLQLLYEERLQHENMKARFPKPKDYDRTGSGTTGQIRAERFLGVAEAVLKKDAGSFRLRLALAAELKLSLLNRSGNGDSIDESYLSMLCYQDIFNALAADRLDIAVSLSNCLRNRTRDVDNKLDVFDQNLGAMVVAIVLELPELNKHIDQFEAVCKQSDNADFIGYATLVRGIVHHDDTLAQEALRQIERGHKKQSKRGGVFYGIEDEVLCVWGIGMCNLALARGLRLTALPPLIPRELMRSHSFGSK